ncbi:MAG: hypothetical protein ACK51F_20550 [Rhodospirillales bacterium]|jgi:hypothetical protein
MRRGERLTGLLLLAVLLFSPVAIGFFQRPALALGVPALLLYVFAAWGAVIALLALAARGGDDGDRT